MSSQYHIQPATLHDIAAILKVVNSAYHGQAGSNSWTSEGHLVAGPRITEENLYNYLQQPTVTILRCADEQGTVVGCVLLEKKKDTLYLGMLSVDPQIQALGIGKLLLLQAETFARDHQYTTITITVIDRRHELIDWYKRKGYKPTGNIQPFTNPSSTALADFSFVELQKAL
jgi:ribosomal protein S18 acetylase RimI-like enzyme